MGARPVRGQTRTRQPSSRVPVPVPEPEGKWLCRPLGLEDNRAVLEPPFEMIEPSRGDSPVLVEVPHAAVTLDPTSMAWLVAPARTIAHDADLYVDELFADSPSLGASLLVARRSRYAIDLNRAPEDHDALAVVGGPPRDRPRGVVWRLSSDGSPVLAEPLPLGEYQRRIDSIWQPYHRALRASLARKHRDYGFAVMLCAHSMPTPRAVDARGASPPETADVVPGSRGRRSAEPRWIDLVELIAREHDLSVEHDVPYRGGYTTEHYGQPERGVHVVQIEIARRLYLDEVQLTRLPQGFDRLRGFARALVTGLVDESRRVYATALCADGR